MIRSVCICCMIGAISACGFALEPDEILVVANANNPDSLQIADYYCRKRSVPHANILKLPLGKTLPDTITRPDYDIHIAHPIRKALAKDAYSGSIKCLLTVYGIPFKVGPRDVLETEPGNLASLQRLLDDKAGQLTQAANELARLGRQKKNSLSSLSSGQSARRILQRLESDFNKALSAVNDIKDKTQRTGQLNEWIRLYQGAFGKARAAQKAARTDGVSLQMTSSQRLLAGNTYRLIAQANKENWDCRRKLKAGVYAKLENVSGLAGAAGQLLADIDRMKGAETGASVDSELSMLMFDDYELYRWRDNELKKRVLWIGTRTLMVSRLDGPDSKIVTRLIDKALAAEKTRLKGNACFDWRFGGNPDTGSQYGQYDRSIQQAAEIVGKHTNLKVVREKTAALFAPGDCPDTALYCGWYSLKKYVDAFDFVDGAVGFHIASFEAVDLRDGKSSQWCPAMLVDGITATLGSVAEPYLGAFPRPDEFFAELIKGRCLVEAYYRTKPYNSWQMLLIGDPLYTPFKSAD